MPSVHLNVIYIKKKPAVFSYRFGLVCMILPFKIYALTKYVVVFVNVVRVKKPDLKEPAVDVSFEKT